MIDSAVWMEELSEVGYKDLARISEEEDTLVLVH